MLERGGHVVNTASIGGLVAFPGLAAYSAAKYGVVGLSESLHHDLRERAAPVGVSVLCPGPVETGFRAHSRALHPAGPQEAPAGEPEIAKIAPAAVAGQVVDAIRTGRFWVLTHPAYGATVMQRARGIVDTDEVVLPGLL
jgi:short-subunit dehydrogenase